MAILTFKSPIQIQGIGDDDTDIIEFGDLPFDVRYKLFEEMRKRLDDDFDRPRLGRGLQDYLPEKMQQIISSVTLDFIYQNEKLYTEIVCISKKELNDIEFNMLKHKIIGQLSDGFGEGFEQHPFITNNKQYPELYICLWNASDEWDLKLTHKDCTN